MNPVPQLHPDNIPPSVLDELIFPAFSRIESRKIECAREDLDDLFEEAIRIPEDEREAFLDRTCFGQPELRWHLELLITHSNQQPPDEFLDPGRLSDVIKER